MTPRRPFVEPLRLVAVEATPSERFALQGVPGVLACAARDLAEVLRSVTEAELVVVGAGAERPAALVELVGRHAPEVAVLVVTTPGSDAGVRAALAALPAQPLPVTVCTGVEGLRDKALGQLARGERRRERAMRATLPHAPHGLPVDELPTRRPVIDLGPLLERAPVGVVLCETDGLVRGWNREAGVLLEISAADPEVRLQDVLPGAVPLLGAFAEGGTGTEFPAAGLIASTESRHLEVTAVPTEEHEGRWSVLLLLVDVTERRHAERDRERLARQVDLLGRISETLVGTLDRDEGVERLADVLVPELGDWISIQVGDELGALTLVTVRHRDPEQLATVASAEDRQSHYASDDAPSRRAARGEGPILMEYIEEEDLTRSVRDPGLRELFRTLGLGSLVAVPLPGRDGILGSMVLVRGEDRPRFTAEDLAVTVEAGRRAGLALDNARLYGMQHDLSSELQRSLLTDPPASPHGGIAVRYVAASHEAQVGGDWYDAFVQPDGATVLVVGDVIGHDRRAAAGMSQVRGVLRGIGYTTAAGPAELLTRTDHALAGLRIRAMATATVLRLESVPGEVLVSWSCAGHPPPMLLTPDGEAASLDAGDEQAGSGETGNQVTGNQVTGNQVTGNREPGPDLLLGLDPATPRTVRTARVPYGSTLLLYTDGLVERRGEDLDDGISRLADALVFAPAEELEKLADHVLEQLLPVEPEDDVALVAVRLGKPSGR